MNRHVNMNANMTGQNNEAEGRTFVTPVTRGKENNDTAKVRGTCSRRGRPESASTCATTIHIRLYTSIENSHAFYLCIPK